MPVDIKEKLSETCFEHIISLGHCCYVGIELEQMGLRDSSMPFDWTRTHWRAIEKSFHTNFKDYLDYDSLYQSKNNLYVYKNLEYGVNFVHDFVDYKPLKKQITDVQQKYQRRIDRFFKNITEPTLFIRYMWDYDELIYIAEHYNEIENTVKSYNKENEIIFISHNKAENIDISAVRFLFFIENSEKHNPLSSNKELHNFLCDLNYKKRESNLKFNEAKAQAKHAKSKTFSGRLKRKAEKWKRSHSKKYYHDKQC